MSVTIIPSLVVMEETFSLNWNCYLKSRTLWNVPWPHHSLPLFFPIVAVNCPGVTQAKQTKCSQFFIWCNDTDNDYDNYVTSIIVHIYYIAKGLLRHTGARYDYFVITT